MQYCSGLPDGVMKMEETKFLIIAIIAGISVSVIVATLIVGFLIYPVPEIPSDEKAEWELFETMTNACNCTIENSTMCHERAACIHAYGLCLKNQCPGCAYWPW